MRIYTVHIPVRPFGAGAGRPDPELDAVAVKEGFCWPAFFLGVLWALWNRLWLVALGLLVAQVLLTGAIRLFGADPLTGAALTLGVAALIGGFANDLRRWTLARRGFGERAVIAAEDRESAVARYLDRRAPRRAPA